MLYLLIKEEGRFVKIQIQQALEGLREINKTSSAKEVADVKHCTQLDQVHLSKEAQILSKALEVVSDRSVNLEKIKVFQEKIDKGTYEVDMEAVAETILKEHLSMS